MEKLKTQMGGVSNSCIGNYASNNGVAKYNLNNPQASSDLDDKTMLYGNPISLGSSIVGGGDNIVGGGDKCGDEGVGTSNIKTETFKEYLQKLNSNFNISATGGFNKMQKHNNKKSVSRKRTSSQKGSGYVVDPSQFIAGQPVYKQYDDASPPALIGGQMIYGAPDQPVCGSGAVRGGGTRKRSKKHMNKSKKSKKSKSKNYKKYKNTKRRYQHGGDFTSIGNSKPAEYSTAFNGPPSVFKYPDDMSGRTFDETQPIWSPNAI
jgi:hypothetical protein